MLIPLAFDSCHHAGQGTSGERCHCDINIDIDICGIGCPCNTHRTDDIVIDGGFLPKRKLNIVYMGGHGHAVGNGQGHFANRVNRSGCCNNSRGAEAGGIFDDRRTSIVRKVRRVA